MKLLVLVRHAKSSWEDPGLEDVERPLNPRGLRDAPRMGLQLERRRSTPDHIVSSPAQRAHATAEIFAERLGYPRPDILIEPRVYEAGVQDLLEVIREFDDAHDFVIMFGHNPAVTSLVNKLTNATLDNVPTCGVAEIEFAVEYWREAAPAHARLVEFDYPKKDTK